MVAKVPTDIEARIVEQEVIHKDSNTDCKLTLMFILFSSTLKMRNSLPVTVIEGTNVEDFKKRVLKYFCINLAAV